MLPTDPNTSMATPFSSSGELDYEDASIYFRVERNNAYEWYVIEGNSKTPEDELLRPIFPPPPKHQSRSGCGVLGSTIYVLGGIEYDPDRPYCRLFACDDVFYMDTRRPSCGWKKGCPMTRPRDTPYAVTVDGKMYVLGCIVGRGYDMMSHRGLRCSTVCGHAVTDNKRKILFHGCREQHPRLYSYDIESDTWGIYSESSLGNHGISSSAFVDGILYCMDRNFPGIYGLDVSNPENQIQKVLGCDQCCLPHEWYEGCLREDEFMVSLGNSSLAVIWPACRRDPDGHLDRERFDVCCSKLKMSKCLNATTGQIDFVATPLSISYYSVMGSKLVDFLAVFPSKKVRRKMKQARMQRATVAAITTRIARRKRRRE
ncbi:hypothetical protein RHMOL_Rhmol01G0006500 [Rhododendron molle]|uniref:Uncharacterized protein n=1 Tax=Rhododendron molle TaxID=49168 RepID=A0ACC0PYK2_RHOML|nr:hypothetical protein RHMOL_Rhmol01G0006500 [Rhododendron molle]